MQRRFTFSILTACLFVLAACTKEGGPAPQPGKDLDLTPTELQKVAADNQFTLKLFKAIAGDNSQPDNIFTSPLSVSFAIGMTANGAAGETSTAIRNTMLFNNFTEDQVNAYYNKLITGLPLVDPTISLKIANSVWYDQNFTVLPQFLQTNSSSYNAKVQKADFKAASTLSDINGWVSQQTNNKIPKIIDNINSDAVMYLINAVYFKSAWKQKFDASKTTKKTFYTNQGSSVQADFMMQSNVKMNAYIDAAAKVGIYELPYVNDKFSMVIFRPEDNSSLQQLAANVDGAKVDSWISKLKPATFSISLPKFKFSFGKSLKPALSDMGMANAFSNQANFSRINAGGGLSISDVKHKGYVEVNEQGTEAAAVTSVEITYTSAGPNVTFDRPFIFAIREVKTGLILFIGVMNNPLLAGS